MSRLNRTLTFLSVILLVNSCKEDLFSEHIPFYNAFHHQNSGSKLEKSNSSCWGYEEGCTTKNAFGVETKSCRNAKTKQQFWDWVDFGYVKEVRRTMVNICESSGDDGSFLTCSKNMRFCKGKNLYLNFGRLYKDKRINQRYREDLFEAGEIGADCKLNKSVLLAQGAHKHALQSWYAELQNFTSLATSTIDQCDVTISGPVVFVKLDFGGNMFHHFCDFFNLYASQHVNGSLFGKNTTVIMWDTMDSHYFDPFRASWKVFTNGAVRPLVEFAGKRVCVKGEVMFPLLARMQHGLFYNSYVPAECSGSNLFRAFSEHFLHRMRIRNVFPPPPPHASVGSSSSQGEQATTRRTRVTFLQRGSPESKNVYRQVKNQPELLGVLSEFADFDVRVVEYNSRDMSFEEQLNITHNTDIFIGMHGAGLTHFLFLPKWAVAVELYNCGDKNCYNDLARLRGVTYLTWSSLPDAPEPRASEQGQHPRYGKNPKFWNWSFDTGHFRKLVSEARTRLNENMAGQQHQQRKGSLKKYKVEL